MKPSILSLCLNVFPGNNLAELHTAIFTHAAAIFADFRRLNATAKNPTAGLWLNDKIAKKLLSSNRDLSDLINKLHAAKINVVTLNAFPFAIFHGQKIKEKVYQPDWSTSKRLAYTKNCAQILAMLLPKNENIGTISSLPLGYAKNFNARKLTAAKKNLSALINFLQTLERQSGKRILLALEPEPDCYLDTPQSVQDFFTDFYKTAEFTRRYIGLCLDTAHTSARFLSSEKVIEKFSDAKIPVYKLQLSRALSIALNKNTVKNLSPFNDHVYLHQCAWRFNDNEQIFTAPDLPAAIKILQPQLKNIAAQKSIGELRAHYHLPFSLALPHIQPAEIFSPAIFHTAQKANCQHFESEIYTLGLLKNNNEVNKILANELKFIAPIVNYQL